MALEFITSYNPHRSALLTPPMSIGNAASYGNEVIRLVIDFTEYKGKLTHKPVHGVMAQFKSGIYSYEGPVMALNSLLRTISYEPAFGHPNPTQAKISLTKRSGGSVVDYQHIATGTIQFFVSGYEEGQIPPPSTFSPVWITPPVFPTTTDNNYWSGQLDVSLETTLSGDKLSNYADGVKAATYPAGMATEEDEVSVSEILVNGISLDASEYEFENGLILINRDIADRDSVVIRLFSAFTFAMQYTDSGATLYSHANSAFVSANLPLLGAPKTFSFVVQATSHDGRTTSQTFSLPVTPSAALITPEWSVHMPEFLGQFTRGSPISVDILTNVPLGTGLADVRETASDAAVDIEFLGLPDGVRIENGTIVGVIDPAAPVGFHHFRLSLYDALNMEVDYREFRISVASPSGTLEPLRFVRWTTPAGNLGSFSEGETSPVGVRAYATTGEAVTYSLFPPSTELPLGITLNHRTGDLEGVFGNTNRSASTEVTYNFAIRASVGNAFLDRAFSVNVRPRYRQFGSTDVFLPIGVRETKIMSEAYKTAITDEDLFRPTDINFKSLTAYSVYLIGGVSNAYETRTTGEGLTENEFGAYTGEPTYDHSKNPELDGSGLEYIAEVIRTSNYKGPITLRLGAHRVAKVYSGGTLLYEVVYREVHDPMEKAGGFLMGANGAPQRDTPIHPQSGHFFYPNSVNNFRCDIVRRSGFDGFDPSMNQVIGHRGIENLPAWMRSPQTPNSPSTALGFTLGMPVAFVKPNRGQAILDRIVAIRRPAQDALSMSDPMLMNHEISFDRVVIKIEGYTDQTFFDNWDTYFDGDLTTFDFKPIQEGHIQLLNAV